MLYEKAGKLFMNNPGFTLKEEDRILGETKQYAIFRTFDDSFPTPVTRWYDTKEDAIESAIRQGY